MVIADTSPPSFNHMNKFADMAEKVVRMISLTVMDLFESKVSSAASPDVTKDSRDIVVRRSHSVTMRADGRPWAHLKSTTVGVFKPCA